MSIPVIKPWVESVELHPDVISPNFSEDIFALDLGPLADGNKNVPAVYRDPEKKPKCLSLCSRTVMMSR